MSSDMIRKVFLDNVAHIIETARSRAKAAVDLSMVYAYFEIGRLIVEEEQHGSSRAEYGKYVIPELSGYLTSRVGKGFSETNLKQMRKFYQVYRDDTISQTLSDELTRMPKVTTGRIFPLSWSHYLKLMRIENPDARRFYEVASYQGNWGIKELSRQFDSALYERMALGRDPDRIKELSEKGMNAEHPSDAVKDPYVLEFLGLKEEAAYSENDLESRIIDHLQEFLLELGKGFAFIGRQVRFTFDDQHFRVDLVFYNRMLRCFVLIDLKMGELKHQDLGQMQMYVHYYDRYEKREDENPTIGILLCQKKNDMLVKLTLPENSNIYASQYDLYLPDRQLLEEKLQEWIAEETEDSGM